MKRFTIVIESNDTANVLNTMIQLFLKSLRLRSLSTRSIYKIEEVNNDKA